MLSVGVQRGTVQRAMRVEGEGSNRRQMELVLLILELRGTRGMIRVGRCLDIPREIDENTRHHN